MTLELRTMRKIVCFIFIAFCTRAYRLSLFYFYSLILCSNFWKRLNQSPNAFLRYYWTFAFLYIIKVWKKNFGFSNNFSTPLGALCVIKYQNWSAYIRLRTREKKIPKFFFLRGSTDAEPQFKTIKKNTNCKR